MDHVEDAKGSAAITRPEQLGLVPLGTSTPLNKEPGSELERGAGDHLHC